VARFVVLLRGVNVGKGKRVPMADFKRLLEGLGFTDVKTLLNSGNAVVTSTARSTGGMAAAVASALREQLNVATPVIVKSASQLRAVIQASPPVPPEAQHSRYLVVFGPDQASLHALAGLHPLVGATETFAIHDEAAFLHCPQGVLESKVGEALLGKAGAGLTTRNWATVLKLAALAGLPVAVT
jgi:uncharacterized protein (DUF1697 family)